MVKQISKTEILVSRAKSLMEKLLEGISLHHKHQQRQNTSSKEEIRQVIDDLLTQPETLLRGAARGCGGQSVLGILQRRNVSDRSLVHVKRVHLIAFKTHDYCCMWICVLMPSIGLEASNTICYDGEQTYLSPYRSQVSRPMTKNVILTCTR